MNTIDSDAWQFRQMICSSNKPLHKTATVPRNDTTCALGITVLHWFRSRFVRHILFRSVLFPFCLPVGVSASSEVS